MDTKSKRQGKKNTKDLMSKVLNKEQVFILDGPKSSTLLLTFTCVGSWYTWIQVSKATMGFPKAFAMFATYETIPFAEYLQQCPKLLPLNLDADNYR